MSTELPKLKQSLSALNMNSNDLSLKNRHKNRKKIKKNKKINKTNKKIIETKDYFHDSTQVEDNEHIEDTEEDNEEMIVNEIKAKKDSKIEFKFCGYIEVKNEKPIYGVQFNHYLPKDHNYFATVGSNSVTIYECLKNGTNRLVQCYSDPDKNEEFWTCVWSYDDMTGNPLIIAGGMRGVIRVIDCGLKECVKHLIGHGSAVNELKINKYDCNLLLSSSKDYSLRLWNIKSGVCIVKFGGDSGHRDQVISADFHMLSNKYIISAGMDHSIKIWSIDKKNIKDRIKESYDYKDGNLFMTECEHFPVFNTRDVHNNYIDCVQFFGNFVLSKSLDNQIICWKPKQLDSKSGFPISKSNECYKEMSLIDRIPLNECNIWFIKFSMDQKQRLLAVGNAEGVTFVWDTDLDDPFDVKPAQLIHPKCKSTVRQTSFSSDGSILICVCQDSTIWRWSLTQKSV